MSQRTRARTTGDATPRRNNNKAASSKADSKAEPAQTTETLQTPQTARSGDDARAVRSTPQTEHQAAPTGSAFAPESLVRTLRAVAAELERDPDLARRVARAAIEQPRDAAAAEPAAHVPEPVADAPESVAAAKGKRVARAFHPRLVTGLSPDLGQGVVDPFALYATRGEDGLRAALDELRLGSLRAILREHHLDPSGKLAQQNDAEKLRAAILTAAKKRRS